MPYRFLILACLIALTACAGAKTQLPKHNTGEVYEETEKQYAYLAKSYWKDYQRLYKIAYPILKSSSELCPDQTNYSIGAVMGTRESITTWEIPDRDAVAQAVGADDFMRILAIAPQSAAKKSGLMEKDVIVAVNGKNAAYGEDAYDKFYRQINRELDKDNGAVALTVRRNGKEKNIQVTPDTICRYGVKLEPDRTRNAYADGKNIIFTTAMMRFFQDDKNLALVVGHEIAHNVMKHAEVSKGNLRAGALLGAIITAATGVNVIRPVAEHAVMSNKPSTEAEADYVGTYLTYRAGFDITHAADNWRQMSLDDPDVVTHGGTHPANAERFLAIEKTVAEIQQKRRKGLPIQPDMLPAEDNGASESSSLD